MPGRRWLDALRLKLFQSLAFVFAKSLATSSLIERKTTLSADVAGIAVLYNIAHGGD